MVNKCNLIRSISFLGADSSGNERRFVVRVRGGKFDHAISWLTPTGNISSHYRFNKQVHTRSMTAHQLVEAVKDGDPVLELMDDTKLRVFIGGEPSAMLVMAACVLDSHDAFFSPPIPSR